MKRERYAIYIDEISDNEIVDYLKNELKMSQELANGQMQRFKHNEDIFDEFKYWFYNYKIGNKNTISFEVENPVEIQGYTSSILYEKFGDRLHDIGIYYLLISLRENPKETLDLIKRGLPRH